MKKMKAMKVMAATMVLTMAMGTPVMAAQTEVIEKIGVGEEKYSKDIKVKGTYETTGNDYVYAINLTWGGMDFVYNAATEWDPNTLKYTDENSHWKTTAERVAEDKQIPEDTEMTPEIENELRQAAVDYSGITVLNCSNDNLSIVLDFKGNEGIKGTFSTEQFGYTENGEEIFGKATTSENRLSYQLDSADKPITENGKEKGAPTGAVSILNISGAPITENGEIGTLTITIEPARVN